MEKNKFLMINDLIYEIYLWKNVSDIDAFFFQRLKMIVPFEYASLFLHDETADNPDSLQYTIVFQQKFLGVLTLFRTRSNGTFVSDDMFYLRAVAMHLNPVLHRMIFEKSSENPAGISGLAQLSEYHLTAKETEILKCLLNFQDNEEIAETLHIKETTLNKHLQNLFRKLEVRSRWELLRKLRT